MKRALLWMVAVVLTSAGLLGASIYLVALVVNDDRPAFTTEYGSVFAFSVVAATAGLLVAAALIGKLPRRTRLPNEWLAVSAFILAVGAGGALAISERFEAATPFLAMTAAAALFVFLGRLVTRWSPDRDVGSRGFVLPAVWGAIGAPFMAGVVQIGTAVMLIFGAVGGIYLADESLSDDFEPWINEITESADLSVIETPTVSFAALGLLGVTAPLTEELTKFLGVFLLYRKRVTTKYGLFIAGAASGLGFAVVETLGYALMAAEAWPQIMLLRAPVALIHVAATTIVALGWYQHRKNGGYALVGYFGLAVLLHAAWNSLFVSMMIAAAGVENPDTVDPAAAGLVLVLVGAMGMVLLGSILWIVANSRRLGRESRLIDDVSSNLKATPERDATPMYSFRA